MNIRKTHIVIAIIFCVALLHPSVLASDSLTIKEKWLTSKRLTEKELLKIYDDLCWGYQSSNFKKSRDYAFKGIELADKLRDNDLKCYFHLGLGMSYALNSQRDSSLMHLLKAKQFSASSSDQLLLQMINHELGNTYLGLSQYKDAMKMFQTNIRLANQNHDDLAVCYSTISIGIVYMNMQNYEMAEEYMLAAKKIAEKTDYENGMASSLTNLDEIYLKQKEYNKGKGYSEKAAELYHKLNQYPEEIHALLICAQKELFGSGNTDKALIHAQKALNQAIQLGFSNEIGLCYKTLCMVYYQKDEIAKANEYAQKALVLIDPSEFSTAELYNYLTKCNIDQGNRIKAKQYVDSLISFVQKYSDKELHKAISDMEVKYETENKEMRIAQLQRKHYTLIWIAGSSATILLLLVVLLYFRFRIIRQKKRLAEQQIEKIEKEKQLVATQALLDGETLERARLSRDLHDGLGGLLSVTKHKIAQMKSRVIITDENLKIFQSALDMLDISTKELRRVAHNLMPESLIRQGLNAAISDLCSQVDIITYQFFGKDERFNEKLEIAAFRIVNELINNAIKHSKATEIVVQYVKEHDRISITIYDNGCGFDVDKIDTTKTGGINNLRTRIDSFNGKLYINSKENEGTEIIVDFKLSEDEQEIAKTN